MVRKPLITQGYSLAEEVANSISHGIGLVFGIVGLVLLLVQAVDARRMEDLIVRLLEAGAARPKHASDAAAPQP